MRNRSIVGRVAAVAVAATVAWSGLLTLPASAAVVRPNVYGVAPVGVTGMEVHALDGATTYDSWKIHAATPMDAMNAARWKFTFGDFNNDSIADLYMIDTTNKGITVLNGANGFNSRFGTWNLPSTMTSLANGDWRFRYATGDADLDGQDDLFLLDARDNAGQNTAIHVLDAGTNFSTFLAHRRVDGIGILDLGRWGFAVGDSDADSRPDAFLFDSQDNGGQNSAVHILPANLGWTTFAAHRRIEDVAALDLKRWQFSVADYDGDKKADVYLVDTQDNGGKNTAVHLVSSASGWTQFSMHHRSAVTQDLNPTIFPTLMAWAPVKVPPVQVSLRTRIAQLALGEVGQVEAICDRYNQDCWVNDQVKSWCAMFATWTWRKAGIEGSPTGIYVARGLGKWGVDHDLFKARPSGQVGNPQVGDWVIYGPPDGVTGGHVQVVVGVNSNGTITVVGGNESDRVVKSTIDPTTERSGTSNVAISGYVSPPGA